jgi:hypothetical protein
MTGFVEEAARRTPVRYETQVLVVGGGSAGVAAAVASARAGAETILVERGTYLGGLATGGLIVLLLTLDDGRGRQVIRGLCQEVTERMAARGGAYFPPSGDWGSDDPALVARERSWGLVNGHGPHAVRYSVAYDAEEMKFAFEQMATEHAVKLLYGAWGCEPVIRDGRAVGAVFQAKDGRFAIGCDVLIDTTGDLDLLAAAGCAHESEKVAPWLWFTMGGITDVPAAQKADPRCFQSIGEGRVLLPWGSTPRIGRTIDATSPEDITYASLAARELVMEEVDRLRREVPGFAGAHICHIADQLDVTESRRLVGEYVLDRDDMDRPFDDTIAVTGHWTKYGAVYAIPYRSLLAKEFPNVLTAGRSISVDHRTHHATKEIPACMATGEAAGTAAALAVKAGVAPKSVDVSAVQAKLLAEGALLWSHDG